MQPDHSHNLSRARARFSSVMDRLGCVPYALAVHAPAPSIGRTPFPHRLGCPEGSGCPGVPRGMPQGGRRPTDCTPPTRIRPHRIERSSAPPPCCAHRSRIPFRTLDPFSSSRLLIASLEMLDSLGRPLGILVSTHSQR